MCIVSRGVSASLAAAHRRGATVIAVDLDDRKLAVARLAGAAHVVDVGRNPLHERLAALTDGHGPEVVIEAVGSPATFLAAVAEVSFAGRVVYVGYTREPVTYDTKPFVQKELDGARVLVADAACAG